MEKLKLKLRIAHTKCPKCGFERTLYFMSDFSYGERIVTTNDGKLCAYSVLFEENTIDELKKLCSEVFDDMHTDKYRLTDAVRDIYGITCDPIDGNMIDNTPQFVCCICGNNMNEDEKFGEKIEEVEAVRVTHNAWNNLTKDAKKVKIIDELKRLKFLKGA